jgi:peptide-N4-(N-acetyl-beta-glucosaminyl)asparagine amidase
MHEIRKLRRENMDKEQRRRLMKEDEREERELRGYVAASLTEDMINSFQGATISPGQEVKTSAQLEQEAAAWASQQDTR